jgi:hypothetical protein
MTPPITPPIEPPDTPPHTIHVGYRSFVNLSFGTIVGAISLPWSVNALFTGAARITAAAGAGGGGGGATRNVDANCFISSESVKLESSENRSNQQDCIDCQADEGIDQSRTAFQCG